MQGKGKPAKTQDHANTIWLAANERKPTVTHTLRPFGWVELKPLSATESEALQKQHQAVCADIQAAHQRLGVEKRQREEELHVQLLAAQEKARQAALRQAEAEKAQAVLQTSWESMSELERDLAAIRRDEVALRFAANDASDPNQTIWKKIDTAGPEHQQALASAFMARWQSEKSWSKKDCSKKQFEKVQKVKAILGIA